MNMTSIQETPIMHLIMMRILDMHIVIITMGFTMNYIEMIPGLYTLINLKYENSCVITMFNILVKLPY